jgi:hypothetical protein
MMFMRARLALCSAAIGVTAVASLAVAGSAAAASAGHQSAGTTVVVTCAGHGVAKPRGYVITCADANDYLSKMSWANWRPGSAFGSGTDVVNDCTPNCAAGKFKKYPVLAVLWRAESLPHGASGRFFSRLTLIYTSKIPSGYRRTTTFSLLG